MTKKSLRRLTRRSARYSDVMTAVYETGDDFRSAIITRSALIDVGLERLIKSRMRRLSSDDYNALFTGTAPLAGLSAKIRVAYALGLIGPHAKHDLNTINEIRNAFAHAPHTISLRNERLWARAKSLHTSQDFLGKSTFRGERLTRDKRLLWAIGIYNLDLYFIRPPRTVIMARKKLRPSSSRDIERWGRALQF
jgi:DNA-binding MltR family transcriptional regulator